jgi:hypothetical protein
MPYFWRAETGSSFGINLSSFKPASRSLRWGVLAGRSDDEVLEGSYGLLSSSSLPQQAAQQVNMEAQVNHRQMHKTWVPIIGPMTIPTIAPILSDLGHWNGASISGIASVSVELRRAKNVMFKPNGRSTDRRAKAK